MVKKNKSNAHWILILIVGFFLIFHFMNQTHTPDDPGAVDIGTEVPAYVDGNGYCVGREGIEMGLCCAVWDPEQQKEVWVLCEQLVNGKFIPQQAFFTFEGADRMEGVSSIMFIVRVKNTGNTAVLTAVDTPTVTSVTSGDAAGRTEIFNGFNSLTNDWNTINPNAIYDWSMHCSNRIRLDIPSTYNDAECGNIQVNAFEIADGLYEAEIPIKYEDEIGQIHSGGSRKVQMLLEQEDLSFMIEVINPFGGKIYSCLTEDYTHDINPVSSFTIRAKGTADPGPNMDVYYNNELIYATQVNNHEFQDFVINENLGLGNFEIVFDNDGRDSYGVDRNLYIESITIGSTVLTVPDGVIDTGNDWATKFDCENIRTSSYGSAWNAAIRYKLT